MELSTTRFNKETYIENSDWRNKYKHEGCIYNCPVKIAETILPETVLFVIEMNNSINKIEGIGLIKNRIIFDKKYKIYEDNNYNRFTYKSKYRLARTQFNIQDEKILKILDILLFTGSRHMKRGQGIQILPKWITNNRHYNFTEFFHLLFKKNFKEDLSNN